MASNTPRNFKHPLPGRNIPDPAEVRMILPDQLLNVCKDTGRFTRLNWNGLNLVIRRMIDLDEMSQLVGMVLDGCWNENMYMKELMDFMFRCAVVTYYSNVYLPENNEMRYKIVYETDLYDTVKDNINEGQFAAIESAVKMYIGE